MRNNFIIDILTNCIDSLEVNDFMKGYITAIVVNPLLDDLVIKSYDNSVNEVDIPDFMKREFYNN